MWRDDGLIRGYFGTKCNEIERRKRVRYTDILELYIYYCFVMFELDCNDYEQEIFRDTANFYYMQGQYEAMKEPRPISDYLFKRLIDTPSANGYTLEEYKGAKALNSTYQIHRQATMDIQQGRKPIVNRMEQELEREQNERLKIRQDIERGLIISGVIDMLLIGINNMAKVEGIAVATGDDAKVKFVAIRDEKTTKMCKSLDGQLFNIHGKNTFTRWSDSDKAMRRYTCDGLVLGLNLPNITNHFHWCRSTIIYNIDKPDKDWYDKYVEMKTGNKEL